MTVTVCSRLQLSCVNVSVSPPLASGVTPGAVRRTWRMWLTFGSVSDSTPIVELYVAIGSRWILMSPVGCIVSRTVKVSVVPFSETRVEYRLEPPSNGRINRLYTITANRKCQTSSRA